MFRVLIVDDAKPIRESLAKSINRVDGQVVVAGTAGNGKQALAWLESYYADICVTDIRMPRMDGLDLIEQMNQRWPWMASIVVSSYDEFEYARKSLSLGALDYILKPIERSALDRAVKRTANKLMEERRREAAQLLTQKLLNHKNILDQWLEHLNMLRTDSMPLLIVDTLELFESWTGQRFEQLSPLCDVFLDMIGAELTLEKVDAKQRTETFPELWNAALPNGSVRRHFRLCAVRKLEVGAHELSEKIREAKDGKVSKLVADIVAYIDERCTGKLRIREIADHVGISKNYLGTLFRQEMHTTVLEYITEKRMQIARELLLQSHMKCYEVSNSVGYDDVDHFTKVFKRHFGLTPMELKKRLEC